MQPHAACALELANFVWNRPEFQKVIINGSVSISVFFKPVDDDEYQTYYFTLNNFKENEDRNEFSVDIVRTNGGINCTMTVRRDSLDEGATIEMTHSQQHVAGLTQEFDLYRQSIINGQHYESEQYGDFKANIHYRDRVNLKTEVVTEDNQTEQITYEVKIESIDFDTEDVSDE